MINMYIKRTRVIYTLY